MRGIDSQSLLAASPTVLQGLGNSIRMQHCWCRAVTSKWASAIEGANIVLHSVINDMATVCPITICLPFVATTKSSQRIQELKKRSLQHHLRAELDYLNTFSLFDRIYCYAKRYYLNSYRISKIGNQALRSSVRIFIFPNRYHPLS